MKTITLYTPSQVNIARQAPGVKLRKTKRMTHQGHVVYTARGHVDTIEMIEDMIRLDH